MGVLGDAGGVKLEASGEGGRGASGGEAEGAGQTAGGVTEGVVDAAAVLEWGVGAVEAPGQGSDAGDEVGAAAGKVVGSGGTGAASAEALAGAAVTASKGGCWATPGVGR